MDMDAAVSTLTALSIFASTVEHGRHRRARRLQERARVQGDREERWEVGPVGEVGGAAVRPLPLRPAVPRGRRPRRLAADTDGGVARPAGVPRGADRGRLALHCCVRFRRRRRAVLPAAALSLPFSLECLPNLYKDLQKVFKFPKVEKIPRRVLCDAKEQPIHSGEQEKTSDEADSSGSDSDGNTQSDKVQKQPRANRKHIDSITLVEIAQYFHLPIREASKTLKIGVSILKRKCRKYGIPRWPHRKIKSLDSLIQDLEFVLEDDPEEGRQELLQMEEEKQAAAIKALTKRKKMLESEKEILQQKPALDLMTETKLFREDVFKRRYRAKSAAIDMEMEMETEYISL